MALPIELAFQAVAEKEVQLPFFTGHIIRGLLFQMLRRVNPSLSNLLHQPNVPKPYSIAGLYFKSKARLRDAFMLDPTYPCAFKLRFLQDTHADDLLRYFHERNTITIADATFSIIGIHVRSKTYEDLQKEYSGTQRFRLVFTSPTYLASKGTEYHNLFPEPRRLFLNLAKLWNQTAKGFEVHALDEYADWLKANVGVTGYHLQTRMVQFGEKQAVGFMGWANYRIKKENGWNRTTLTLATFAELSNVGANRTGGFGVTKLLRKEPSTRE